MEIEVHLFGPLREPVGEKSLPVSLPEGATVGDAIDHLGADHPELADRLLDGDGIADGINLTRNRQNVAHLEGLDTSLSDGDVLRAAPPVKGG